MNRHLTLDPDEMRRLGYRVVDLVVEHLGSLDRQPPISVISRADARAALAEPAPDQGRDPDAVLERLTRDVLPHLGRVHHPRFFAFVPGPSNFVSVLGETLAAGFNVFAGSWIGGSAASALELVTVSWLREMVGYPPGADGLFVSGGSMANLTALAVARDHVLGADPAALARGTAYFSDQTHSAVERAFRVLGIRRERLRSLPSTGQRLRLDALEAAIADDRRAGLTPFAVVANAGTTNTGAVDPLPELADLCATHGLWLHVDGAYGAAAALVPEGRRELAGLEGADSMALDPHKWLFQPFEIGCVLVREGRRLPETFAVHPEYLEDRDLGLGEIDFLDHGIQLTRSFRALKLWLSVQVFGLDAFRAAVEQGLAAARRTEELLSEAGIWEIVTPAHLGVVTFRHRDFPADVPGADAYHRRLTELVRRDGYAFFSSTRLDGRTVLRLCTINPRTTDDDLAGTVDRLGELAAKLREDGGQPRGDDAA